MPTLQKNAAPEKRLDRAADIQSGRSLYALCKSGAHGVGDCAARALCAILNGKYDRAGQNARRRTEKTVGFFMMIVWFFAFLMVIFLIVPFLILGAVSLRRYFVYRGQQGGEARARQCQRDAVIFFCIAAAGTALLLYGLFG